MPTTPSHELDAPPWMRFESTLMATSRQIRRAYDLRLAPLGLNLSESCILAAVAEGGPQSQVGLARRLDMNRASAGAVVDTLVKRGLVERVADPGDRRVWLVEPTDQGRRVAAEVAELDRALRAELRRGLSRDERRQLAAALVQLQHNLAGVLEG